MSPRRDISFSRHEAEEFLRAHDHVVLIASSGDDAPLGVPARASFDDGMLVVSVPAGDRIVAALNADPRACCIAEEFPSYYGIKSVIVHGSARPSGRSRNGEASFAVSLEELTTFDFGRLLQTE